MTLRTKTILIISLTLIAVVTVLFFIARFSLQRGFGLVEQELTTRFTELENNETHKNVNRFTDALDENIDNIGTKLADWAQWDDTYCYVKDLNKQYAKSNLSEQALSALKLNFLAIMSASGTLVFSFAYDLETQKKIPLPDGLMKHLDKSGLLLGHKNPTDLVRGIVFVKQGPMLIASRPIVTSDCKGPIRGCVIFGQFLNTAAINRLAKLTHLKVEMHASTLDSLPPDFREAHLKINKHSPVFIRSTDREVVSGYCELLDIYSQPVLLFKISTPRDIFNQGQNTLQEVRSQGRVLLLTLVFGVLSAGIFLGIAIILVLELLVLSRLGRLSSSAIGIGASKDFSHRVAVDGHDELAKLANAINEMLASLAQSHGQIEKRNSEMGLLMNSLPIGLLSLNETFCINPEYSLFSEKLLGKKDLVGKSFFDVLGLSKNGPRVEEAGKLYEFLDVFQKEPLPEKDLLLLNPFELFKFTEDGQVRWLKLLYYLIRRQGAINHILVVIVDYSTQKALEEQISSSQQENLQLKAIVEDPELFCEFLLESNAILKQAQNKAGLLKDNKNSISLVNDIFRGIHTIKGISGIFALTKITQTAGTIENDLVLLRNNNHLSLKHIEQTQTDLQTLKNVFDEVKNSVQKLLGTDLLEESGTLLHVPLSELNKHMEAIEALLRGPKFDEQLLTILRQEIVRRFALLKKVPASKGLARAVKIIPGLIERLGKNAAFSFEGQDTPLDFDSAHELTNALAHLIRNAFDHGLESSEIRASLGKPAQGLVKLSVKNENNQCIIDISDDGAGIDPEEIKAVAVKQKLIRKQDAAGLSLQETYELLFKPGFSTKSEVTEVSGRGVGLDVVVNSVKNKLHGDITVESVVGKGTRFIIRVAAQPFALSP